MKRLYMAVFDVIFAVDTIKHLPKAMAVKKNDFDILDNKGFLICDYVKSKGKGLNFLPGLIKGHKFMEFIENNFLVLSGLKFLKNPQLTGSFIVLKK